MNRLNTRKKIGLLTTLILSSLTMLVLSGGCGSSGGGTDVSSNLQQMVAQKWSEYGSSIGYPSTGGAALYISSPKGDFFVQTNMGDATSAIHFRIASNTKTFTAAAIMLLYQRGQLNIDDLITARIPGKDMPYIPESPNYNIPYKNSITIRQLLGHTAGVFDVTNDKIPDNAWCWYAGQEYMQGATHQYSFDELVGVVAECRIAYWEPWQNRYHYSNTGYNLLGKIIERVSGTSYSDFIKENLIRPNNLMNTTSPYLAADTKIPDPFPVGYSLSEGTLTAVREDNMSMNVAEGNIISTPAELSTWVKRLISGTAGIDKRYVDMMNCAIPEGKSSCYGLGVLHLKGIGYGHNGAHNGYLSLMMYDPADDVSLVLFFSLLNFDNIQDEMNVLLSISEEARKILGY